MSIRNHINENGWLSDFASPSNIPSPLILALDTLLSKIRKTLSRITKHAHFKINKHTALVVPDTDLGSKKIVREPFKMLLFHHLDPRVKPEDKDKEQLLLVLLTQWFQKKSIICLLLFSSQIIMPFTVMIDPCGDAKHTGRVIQDTFERGITLQCAELLKKELNKAAPDVRVVLTRVPGETIQPLQNASFANRLQADLYLSISFYLETDIPSHITLFQYITAQTDYWHKYSPLCFYHVSQAHLINVGLTTLLGKKLLKLLETNSINSFFLPQGLFAIPYKPLVGIKAPALAIEAGINQKDDFKYIIKPLVAFICEIAS